MSSRESGDLGVLALSCCFSARLGLGLFHGLGRGPFLSPARGQQEAQAESGDQDSARDSWC